MVIMDRFCKSRISFWMMAAVLIVVAGCSLGQADDAPGVGGLSMLAALAMVLHALVLAGLLVRRRARLMIDREWRCRLLVCGCSCCALW